MRLKDECYSPPKLQVLEYVSCSLQAEPGEEETEVRPGCPTGLWQDGMCGVTGKLLWEVGQLREEIQTDTGPGPILSDEVLDPPPSPFLAQDPLTRELEPDTAPWLRL